MTHHYTFTFKKDDMFVDFTTTDKDLVERQFKIWVTCASVYTYNQEHQTQNQIYNAPQQQVQDVQQSEQTTVFVEEPKVEYQEPQAQEVSFEQPQKSHYEEAVAEPVSEVQDYNNDDAPMSEQTQEQIEQIEIQGKTIDELFQKPTINQLINPESYEEEVQPENDFDAILENSMENSEFEPNPNRDERFVRVIQAKNPAEKIDYLLIAACYMSEFEQVEKFTLKQINAKLMQNFEMIIDHTVLQEAIDKQFVEAMPDLTGVSGVCEYRLTEHGEEIFANA